MTYFVNFGTPLISLEWLKIQISNFARGMKVRDNISKMEKLVKRGASPRSCDILFLILGRP